MIMRKLAITNQKGGAGKTTLTKHLAEAAVAEGKRVLLADLDPQGSLSISCGLKVKKIEDNDKGLLSATLLFSDNSEQFEPLKLSSGLDIIPADKTLLELNAVEGGERRVARALKRFEREYDLCLIDTPGSIAFNPPMTIAALVAADVVVCPFSVGLFEGAALSDLWEFVKRVKTPAYNPKLRLMGLLPSRINTKTPEEVAGLAELREQFGKLILPGMLAERAAVKKSVMAGKPVWKNTKGASHLAAAREWRAVCGYILNNLEGATK